MATDAEHVTAAGVVEVDGAQLRYRIEGHGLCCLVIGSSAYYPQVFSSELRDCLQLVFVDLRHFGIADSSFDPERLSIDTYADDIEHVRQTLNLGKVVVIGHSIHGTIALEYARRYPNSVQGVVATGAPPYRSDEPPSASERFWDVDASEERKALLARNLAELTDDVAAVLSPAELWVRSYHANGPRFWADPNYDDSALLECLEPNTSITTPLYGELFRRYDLEQGPGEVGVPVLIAHGRYDYAIPHTLWDEHRHKLPHCTYVLFEQSGHTPSFEQPDLFNEVLLGWTAGLER